MQLPVSGQYAVLAVRFHLCVRMQQDVCDRHENRICVLKTCWRHLDVNFVTAVRFAAIQQENITSIKQNARLISILCLMV